jgi:hypothetical protein
MQEQVAKSQKKLQDLNNGEDTRDKNIKAQSKVYNDTTLKIEALQKALDSYNKMKVDKKDSNFINNTQKQIDDLKKLQAEAKRTLTILNAPHSQINDKGENAGGDITSTAKHPGEPDKPKGMANEYQLAKEELEKTHLLRQHFHDEDIEDDLKFWQKKLQNSAKGSILQAQYQKEVNAATKIINNQRIADDLLVIEKEKTAMIEAVESEILSAKDKADKLYQIEITSLREKKIAYGDDKKAKEKIDIEIEKATQSHSKNLAKINNDAAKESLKPWTQMVSSIENAFAKAMTDMVLHAKSFKDAMSGFGAAILESFVGIIAQMVAKWAIGEAAKFASSQNWITAETAVTVGAITAETAEKITAHATEAPIRGATALADMNLAAVKQFFGLYFDY